MLPGFDAIPLKREFKRLVIRALSLTPFSLGLLDDSTASQARSTLGAAASGAVTSSDITMATSRMLGRTTASTGAVEEISIGSGLSLTGGSIDVATAGVTQAMLAEPLTSGTVQSATSGDIVEFTSLPSWVDLIDLVWADVSLSGTDNFLIQLGDAGGYESSGYSSSASVGGAAVTASNGFVVKNQGAGNAHCGVTHLRRVTGNKWIAVGIARPDSAVTDGSHGGSKQLSDTLTQLKIVPTGTNTYDGGSANFQIYYWGAAS